MLSVPYKQMVLCPISVGAKLRNTAGEDIMAAGHEPSPRWNKPESHRIPGLGKSSKCRNLPRPPPPQYFPCDVLQSI